MADADPPPAAAHADVSAVIAALDHGVAVYDRNLRLLHCNPRFAQVLGAQTGAVPRDATVFSVLNSVFATGNDGAGAPADGMAAWRQLLARRESGRQTCALADGRVLAVCYAPLPDGGWTIGIDDITANVTTSHALAEQTIRFNEILSHMPVGLCMFDDDRDLILCSRVYAELYALPAELTRPGTNIAAIMAHRSRVGNAPSDMTGYLQVGTDAQTRQQLVFRHIQLQDGRWVQITHNPMPGGGYVSTHQDVTSAIRAEQESRYLAEHDTLTGLLNRGALRERLGALLRQTQRRTTLAVHCLDLDQFKAVNDTLGHPIGDLLMIAVTRRLLSCVAPDHVLARIGGDEFVILQDALDRPEEASKLACRLIEEIRVPFVIDGHVINIGLSVGTAFHPEHGHNADELLKKADIALYFSKSQGRNTARSFEPVMVLTLQRRRDLELDFRAALARGDLTLSYQPIIDIAARRVDRFEALARWTHAGRGQVPPADFIALAEDTGLIVPLGEWILRQACQDAALWPADVGVAVNLSPAQFRSRGLAELVLSVLRETGLAPPRLEIEITESVLLVDTEATLATLHLLRAAGVRIAMDDFGTGYSSLSYLRSFPFDTIKIDKSFIRDLGDDPGHGRGSFAIVKAVADLGHALGMATTAEGVETHEELQQALQQGCTEAQGFLFSPALPVRAVEDLLLCGGHAQPFESLSSR